MKPPGSEKETDEEQKASADYDELIRKASADLSDEKSSEEIEEEALTSVTENYQRKGVPIKKTARIVKNAIVDPHKIKPSIFRRVLINVYGIIDFFTSKIPY